METKFNVFEILQIAEQVEHRGAKFYIKTAGLFADSDIRDFYYRLAAWKARHEKVWARLRKRFSEKTGEFGTFDPDNYVLSNPPVMAGLTWVGTEPGTAEHLTGRESKRHVLKDALRRANEELIFYRGLEEFARDPASKDAIAKIIREESREVQLLQEEIRKTEAAPPKTRA